MQDAPTTDANMQGTTPEYRPDEGDVPDALAGPTENAETTAIWAAGESSIPERMQACYGLRSKSVVVDPSNLMLLCSGRAPLEGGEHDVTES